MKKTAQSARIVKQKLVALQTELAELAFTLDCQRQPEAADVAMTVSARIREIGDELSRPEPPDTFGGNYFE